MNKRQGLHQGLHDTVRILLETALTSKNGIILKLDRDEATYYKKVIANVKANERKHDTNKNCRWDCLVATIEEIPNSEFVHLKIIDGINSIDKLFHFIDPETGKETTLAKILEDNNNE